MLGIILSPRYFREHATHVEVRLPRFTHMTGILGNGIIHGGIEGACSPAERHNSSILVPRIAKPWPCWTDYSIEDALYYR